MILINEWIWIVRLLIKRYTNKSNNISHYSTARKAWTCRVNFLQEMLCSTKTEGYLLKRELWINKRHYSQSDLYICNVCSPTVPHNQVEDYTWLVEEICLHSQLISVISSTTVLVPIRTAIYFLASFLVDRLHNQENRSDHKCSKPSAWEFPTEGLGNKNRKSLWSFVYLLSNQ